MSNADEVLKKLQEKATAAGLSDDDVAHAVAAAIESISKDLPPLSIELYQELETLASYIKASRQELAALNSTNLGAEHISSATDELDAVTEATADATNNIMNQCDVISEVAAQIGGEAAARLQKAASNIFEACTFQDITGQRIGKVVRTLKHIENQINELVRVFGARLGPVTGLSSDKIDAQDETSLLNGPQLPGNASTQDEIDQLLADFDAPAK